MPLILALLLFALLIKKTFTQQLLLFAIGSTYVSRNTVTIFYRLFNLHAALSYFFALYFCIIHHFLLTIKEIII